MTPLLFHNYKVSQGACNHSLAIEKYGFVWDMFFIYMHAHLNDHLAMKVIITQDC